MNCMQCWTYFKRGTGSHVVDSTKEHDCVKRRRECYHCGHRWNTVEVVAGAKVPEPVAPVEKAKPVAEKPVNRKRSIEEYFDFRETLDDDLDDILNELGAD